MNADKDSCYSCISYDTWNLGGHLTPAKIRFRWAQGVPLIFALFSVFLSVYYIDTVYARFLTLKGLTTFNSRLIRSVWLMSSDMMEWGLILGQGSNYKCVDNNYKTIIKK